MRANRASCRWGRRRRSRTRAPRPSHRGRRGHRRGRPRRRRMRRRTPRSSGGREVAAERRRHARAVVRRGARADHRHRAQRGHARGPPCPGPRAPTGPGRRGRRVGWATPGRRARGAGRPPRPHGRGRRRGRRPRAARGAVGVLARPQHLQRLRRHPVRRDEPADLRVARLGHPEEQRPARRSSLTPPMPHLPRAREPRRRPGWAGHGRRGLAHRPRDPDEGVVPPAAGRAARGRAPCSSGWAASASRPNWRRVPPGRARRR